MIEVKVDDYCQNCPELELELKTDILEFTSYEPVQHFEIVHNITCKHLLRCRAMSQTLRKEMRGEKND